MSGREIPILPNNPARFVVSAPPFRESSGRTRHREDNTGERGRIVDDCERRDRRRRGQTLDVFNPSEWGKTWLATSGMFALGQKQTLKRLRLMSALPPKADIGRPVAETGLHRYTTLNRC